MSDIDDRERQTQDRIIKLLHLVLDYRYLGDWSEREGNSNVEAEILREWLIRGGYDGALIEKALYELHAAANDTSKNLYERNRDVYELLRYGVKVKREIGEQHETVALIDWKLPENNDFAIAEEVTVPAADPKASTKRPDIVLYVNGIAVGILELKRSTVSAAEGIRQNLDNQKKEFIQPFFSTIHLVMAGNDSEGLRYGTIETPEKCYLQWHEEGPTENLLDRALSQLCSKDRLLDLIHNFIAFDAGTKKIARHNQFFGVHAAQEFLHRREGGIIWHTQGSGKSLTMVWLAKWIRENIPDGRVLVITDRTELDEQIEGNFNGVGEKIYRTKSGVDLMQRLSSTTPWLMCTLLQKFGAKNVDAEDVKRFSDELKRLLAKFKPTGDFYIFVDECHRSHSNVLHDAMVEILPNAIFVGFTGTPLLRTDKKSIEVFGRYIHTYKWDQAVREGVILDLRYEARDIDQQIISQEAIDQWFEAKTAGLTDAAKAKLKQRWGTMKAVLSSKSRLEKIVADVVMDMNLKPRLLSGRGNAILVSGSIYEACKLYDLFSSTELKDKCAIVTSYKPSVGDIKGEATGEGETESIEKYNVYRGMLADWFNEPVEQAVTKTDEFERQVKQRFIEQPAKMKLLIVVDQLLTGFDAPPATYLYIDKRMRDHGLFQAICRTNRLDGEDKDYGYIVDYKDLFKSLEGAIGDYTSGAFDGYDKEDIAGLLHDRLTGARQDLEEAREALRALCEPVQPPRDMEAHFRYFCARDSGNGDQLKDNAPKRQALYTRVAALQRTFANIANELQAVGYSDSESDALKAEVSHFSNLRDEVRLNSGDYIDLKMYEPAMRYLIDNYIGAGLSKKVSGFDNLTLLDLIVDRGPKATESLPAEIADDKEAVAETIENNVRKLIINETPIDPAYYAKMSKLLDALIEQRRKEAADYEKYLNEITELVKRVKDPGAGDGYPADIDTPGRRALYNNLYKSETLAIQVDQAVRASRQDGWRSNALKTKRVRLAISEALEGDNDLALVILDIVKNQNEY